MRGVGSPFFRFPLSNLHRVGCAALQAVSGVVRAQAQAQSQAYPARPARILVGFAAGGGADIFARLIAQGLSERLGGQFVVENRPGVGSNAAAEAVAGAVPDGYTLFWATSANATSATFYDRPVFNFVRDIVPVASAAKAIQVMVVNPSFPARTVSELIAYAKAKPGTINMASAGNGTITHLLGELFKMMAGVDMVHVPYRSDTPALTDLIGGQVQVMFSTLAASIEHIKSGNLRALAVTTGARSDALPDVPAVSESVPGMEASGWQGLGAPRNTPAGIIDKLNQGINAALDDPRIKARFAAMGATALPGSPADFGKLIAEDTEKWAKVVKFSGAKPD